MASMSEPGVLPTLVVIEDDPDIADLLDLYLRDAGFRVLLAPNGERGLELIDQHRADFAIVDVGLPGIDGFTVVERLRARTSVPVLLLTARDDEADRVRGLESGADDYVTKPFSPREVVARVRAIRRRGAAPSEAGAVLEIGDTIHLDPTRREVRQRGVAVALTTREFDLLEHLGRHQGIARTRQQLLDHVWGLGWDGDDRTVDVHVAQLRKKLGSDLPLATVWGIGYRLG